MPFGLSSGSSRVGKSFEDFSKSSFVRIISLGIMAWADVFYVANAFEVDSLDFMFTFYLEILEKHVNDICVFRERRC